MTPGGPFAGLPAQLDLARILILRDLKGRYRGTILGFFWTFLNPLLLLGTYTLVFSVFARSGIEHYSAFVLCGLLPWMCFSSSLMGACGAVLEREDWVKSVAFPSHLLPVVTVLTNFLHLLFSLPCLLVFLAASRIPLGWSLLAVVPLLLLQLLLTSGLALIVSAMQVFYRDVFFMLSNLLTLWFFLTPILYPAGRVPSSFSSLLILNPMAPIARAYQEALFYGRFPGAAALAPAAAAAAAALLAGWAVFGRLRPRFAEAL